MKSFLKYTFPGDLSTFIFLMATCFNFSIVTACIVTDCAIERATMCTTVYGIFCGLFLLRNFIRWHRYANFDSAVETHDWFWIMLECSPSVGGSLHCFSLKFFSLTLLGRIDDHWFLSVGNNTLWIFPFKWN